MNSNKGSLIPSFLNAGDTVVIISTARKVSKTELEPAIALLINWNLKVQTGRNLFQESNQFAGTDIERLSDLQEALDNPAIKAVFCARGGYGTPRIIDQINWEKFKISPKWIIGFSDVTVLLNQINNIGICALHAPMPLFTRPEYALSIDLLRDFLFGSFKEIHCSIDRCNKQGTVEGVLIGGNLSLIVNSIGTSSAFVPDGKILFLEDIDEYLYHIDRMMLQLKRAGILSKISGLIIGHFTDMKDNIVPFGKTAYEIILDHISDCHYPVAFNFPVGHSAQNLPLPIGNLSKLTVSNEVVKLEFS